jgi:hypothetical protein
MIQFFQFPPDPLGKPMDANSQVFVLMSQSGHLELEFLVQGVQAQAIFSEMHKNPADDGPDDAAKQGEEQGHGPHVDVEAVDNGSAKVQGRALH